MKLLLLFSSVVSLAAIFLVPGDNSHYVEGESSYIWMPDGYGISHLVNLHVPVNESLLRCKSGENNEYWLYTSPVSTIPLRTRNSLTDLICANAEDNLEDILRVPGDNSHYVEGVSRYIWMPDGEGKPHLVDLHEPVDQSPVHARNGAQNQYWLFTRRNAQTRQILTNGNANSIRNSNYAGNRATKVVVHGWNSNGGSLNQIVQAFLHNCDCNVIAVDWSRVAGQSYNAAVRDVPSVGQHLGNFLIFLFNTAGGNFNNLHLVGHSLGAHVVGNAGRTLNRRARRVTGLDPAGPQWGGNANALSSNAGQFVEAIHTDGRALGIFNPSGHADFYPNGGMNPQPGCGTSVCSHGRANELFASSVGYNRLVGRRCVSLHEAQLSTCNGAALNMGNNVMGKSGSGIFGLRTGRTWPF